MNFQQLIRAPEIVHAALEELPDGRVVCKELVKIYVPARYAERGLAIIGADNYILGIYAMVVQDKYYGVSKVNAMLAVDPTMVNRIKIDQTDNLELVFQPGSVVFKSTKPVKIDTITYRIYDEFLAGGRVSWFFDYEDLGGIFDSALYHAGANIGQNQEVTHAIVSINARDPDNRANPFRSRLKDAQAVETLKPVFISLKAINYTATNTTAKIAGNYQSEGIIGAIINPSERPERIETLLRR